MQLARRRPPLEADSWILRMASLKDSESDILDLDAIEDRQHVINVLGPEACSAET
jgi:hypothetical protein